MPLYSVCSGLCGPSASVPAHNRRPCSIARKLRSASILFGHLNLGRGLALAGALTALGLAAEAHAQASKKPTTTTLITATAPSEAKGAAGKTLVTLTATVEADGQPLTVGEVRLCDASVPQCQDIHQLGTAQITSTGTAAFRYFTAPGEHHVKAVFSGTQEFEKSESVIQSLSVPADANTKLKASGQPAPIVSGQRLTYAQVVSGRYSPAGTANLLDAAYARTSRLAHYRPAAFQIGSRIRRVSDFEPYAAPAFTPATTTSTLAATGSIGNYTLTDQVVSSGVVPPTGNINFMDITGSATLGSAPLVANPPVSFTDIQTIAADSYPQVIATADFNKDGIPDLVVVTGDTYTEDVYLGNGDGTFTFDTALTIAGYQSYGVAVGDFNHDGNPDILVSDQNSSTLVCFLGDGHGAFQPGITSPTNERYPDTVAAGDLDGEGNLDAAVVNDTGSISILSGDGHGHFTEVKPPLTGPGRFSYASQIVAADLNGDGALDLVVGGGNFNQVAIYLNDGHANFTNTTNIPVGRNPYGVAVADFNGDGIPDLVATNYSDNTISVALGAGGGSFLAPVTYAESAGTTHLPYWVGVADFNQDGHPDIVVGDDDLPSLSLFLGSANGTFTLSPVVIPSGYYPNFAAIGDFNLDGLPDLAVPDYDDYNFTIILSKVYPAASATATLTGVAHAGYGTHQADAQYPGDSNNYGSTSNQVPLAGPKSPTTLGLGASETPSLGITLTATLSPYTLNGASSDGETVTFSEGSMVLGTGVLGSGTATYTLPPQALGPYSFSATYAGDTNLLASSGNASMTVTAVAPTITFAVPGHTYGDTPVTLAATSNSSAPITFSYVSGPAMVSGSTLTITGAGPVTVQASQIAAGGYTSGSQSATFTVAKATLSAGIVGNPTKVYDTTKTAMLAPANYQLTGLVGSDGVTVTQPAGTYAAATAGSEPVSAALTAANFAATSGSLSNYVLPVLATGAGTITQAPTNATITWAPPAAIYYGTALSAKQLNATSTVAGSFTYTPAATTVLPAGSQTLHANFTPSDAVDYQAGTASVSLTVNKANPVITWPNPAPIVYGTPLSSTQLDATTPVAGTFFYTGPAGLNPGGSLLPVGTTTLGCGFIPADTTDYSPFSVYASVTVTKATTTTTLAATTTQTLTGTTAVLTATVKPQIGGTPTGTVTYLDGTTTLGSAPVGSSLTTGVLPLGTNNITAVYSGDSNFIGSTSAVSAVAGVAPTKVTLTSFLTTVIYPLGASYTVTVTKGSAALSGTITLLDGTTVISTQTLPASGMLSGTTPSLSPGVHHLQAVYSGNAQYPQGASALLTITVIGL